ncbi:hypothetical protein [Dietzia sp. B44]|uniref:hypothetical protein n=1 Tax=Dietzia sp. B44 TaxID=1630633 RepID=UPI0015FD268F|nr:hypothetical protein [Dietzia sp. B44]MBB1055681.1 hypothetical protein [Dietzia sp. B44]
MNIELQGKRLKLMPDIGPRWGLWSSTPKFSADYVQSGGLVPQNFGLSAELTQALREWNDVFIEHFTVSFDPVQYGWTGEIDVQAWMRDGGVIAEMLALELPEYSIETRFHHYAEYPHLG